MHLFLARLTLVNHNMLGLCRFCLLACCRDLYLLSPASASLWADVRVQLKSFTHLQHFVAALGRPGVAQRLRWLRITHSNVLPAAWSSCIQNLVTALAGASFLQLLDWTIPPGVSPRLESWTGSLTGLRSLFLVSQDVPLQLPACLGHGLACLQELHICAWTWLVPGCIPPSLQWLELYDKAMRELPPAITAATQLTELCLMTNHSRMELAGLTRLTGLRRLVLRAIPIDRQVFDHMARLPLLETLDRQHHHRLAQRTCLASMASPS